MNNANMTNDIIVKKPVQLRLPVLRTAGVRKKQSDRPEWFSRNCMVKIE